MKQDLIQSTGACAGAACDQLHGGDADAKVTRPVLRWHGGKWKIAPWVMNHFPEHRIYVEPFGGAGSVLLRKQRVYAEVYNDLDDVVTNLFRVLRDDAKAARLIEALYLTPFSRAEFNEALLEAEDDVERARHLIVRSFMGFGSNAHSSSPVAEKTAFKTYTRPQDQYRSTGFRANSNKSGTTPAHDWANYPDALPAIIDRLRGVIIEQRPAIDVMAQHDGGGTLHYVDPPYLPETRSPANKYDLKHRIAQIPENPDRLRCPVRLSLRSLRASVDKLASHRTRSTGRRRATANRSALDQSSMRGSPRSSFADAVFTSRRMTHPKTAPPSPTAQLSGDSSSTHSVGVKQPCPQTDNRRFGPSFEKPCRNRETIICTARRCVDAGWCQWKAPAPPPEPEPDAIAYGEWWYERL